MSNTLPNAAETGTPKNDLLEVPSAPPKGFFISSAVVYPETLGVSEPNIPDAIVVYPALADAPSMAAVRLVLELFISKRKLVSSIDVLNKSFLTFICLVTEVSKPADEELLSAEVD